jgi:hemoglobin-like flavoprotein
MHGTGAAPRRGAVRTRIARESPWHAICETAGVSNAPSEAQVVLVQRSWRAVHLVGDTAAELFYGKLFSIAPELRPMFRSDLRDQGRNLTAMISVAVHSLARPEKVALALRQLGARHAAYGVRDEHYSMVGAALLWMLEETLGEAFTPEVEDAWWAAFRFFASTMQEGALELS